VITPLFGSNAAKACQVWRAGKGERGASSARIATLLCAGLRKTLNFHDQRDVTPMLHSAPWNMRRLLPGLS
jgi:hypothetical protein